MSHFIKENQKKRVIIVRKRKNENFSHELSQQKPEEKKEFLESEEIFGKSDPSQGSLEGNKVKKEKIFPKRYFSRIDVLVIIFGGDNLDNMASFPQPQFSQKTDDNNVEFFEKMIKEDELMKGLFSGGKKNPTNSFTDSKDEEEGEDEDIERNKKFDPSKIGSRFLYKDGALGKASQNEPNRGFFAWPVSTIRRTISSKHEYPSPREHENYEIKERNFEKVLTEKKLKKSRKIPVPLVNKKRSGKSSEFVGFIKRKFKKIPLDLKSEFGSELKSQNNSIFVISEFFSEIFLSVLFMKNILLQNYRKKKTILYILNNRNDIKRFRRIFNSVFFDNKPQNQSQRFLKVFSSSEDIIKPHYISDYDIVLSTSEVVLNSVKTASSYDRSSKKYQRNRMGGQGRSHMISGSRRDGGGIGKFFDNFKLIILNNCMFAEGSNPLYKIFASSNPGFSNAKSGISTISGGRVNTCQVIGIFNLNFFRYQNFTFWRQKNVGQISMFFLNLIKSLNVSVTLEELREEKNFGNFPLKTISPRGSGDRLRRFLNYQNLNFINYELSDDSKVFVKLFFYFLKNNEKNFRGFEFLNFPFLTLRDLVRNFPKNFPQLRKIISIEGEILEAKVQNLNLREKILIRLNYLLILLIEFNPNRSIKLFLDLVLEGEGKILLENEKKLQLMIVDRFKNRLEKINGTSTKIEAIWKILEKISEKNTGFKICFFVNSEIYVEYLMKIFKGNQSKFPRIKFTKLFIENSSNFCLITSRNINFPNFSDIVILYDDPYYLSHALHYPRINFYFFQKNPIEISIFRKTVKIINETSENILQKSIRNLGDLHLTISRRTKIFLNCVYFTRKIFKKILFGKSPVVTEKFLSKQNSEEMLNMIIKKEKIVEKTLGLSLRVIFGKKIEFVCETVEKENGGGHYPILKVFLRNNLINFLPEKKFDESIEFSKNRVLREFLLVLHRSGLVTFPSGEEEDLEEFRDFCNRNGYTCFFRYFLVKNFFACVLLIPEIGLSCKSDFFFEKKMAKRDVAIKILKRCRINTKDLIKE